MPGSFSDDVCDRERPARRMTIPLGCQDCARTITGKAVCTGRCFEVRPTSVLEFPRVITRQEYVAMCNCAACRDGVVLATFVRPNNYVAVCGCAACRDGVARTSAITGMK